MEETSPNPEVPNETPAVTPAAPKAGKGKKNAATEETPQELPKGFTVVRH